MKIKKGDKLPDAKVVILEKEHKEITTNNYFRRINFFITCIFNRISFGI